MASLKHVFATPCIKNVFFSNGYDRNGHSGYRDLIIRSIIILSHFFLSSLSRSLARSFWLLVSSWWHPNHPNCSSPSHWFRPFIIWPQTCFLFPQSHRANPHTSSEYQLYWHRCVLHCIVQDWQCTNFLLFYLFYLFMAELNFLFSINAVLWFRWVEKEEASTSRLLQALYPTFQDPHSWSGKEHCMMLNCSKLYWYACYTVLLFCLIQAAEAPQPGEEGVKLKAVIGYNGNGRGNMVWSPDQGYYYIQEDV